MDLFSTAPDKDNNVLPHDGVVNYYGPIINTGAADQYLNLLLNNISWQHDEAVIFGKHITTKRKVAWYGDLPFEYHYSGTMKTALPWTTELTQLKQIAESASGETFNSCLLNLYHNGSEGMAWHSDAERELKKNGAIGSMSFGTERKFAFRHKQTKETVSLMLQHGSLLVMRGITQQHWLHRLPPSTKVTLPRVNLTFRSIVTF